MSVYNPYLPPRGEDLDPPLPATSRGGGASNIPYIMGILSIIFASLVLVVGPLASLGVQLAASDLQRRATGVSRAGKAPSARRATRLQREAREARLVGGFLLGISLMAGGLLAAGIGSLRYRRWALRWTIGWSLLAIALLVLMGGLAVLAFSAELAIGWSVGSFLVLLPYPVLLLVLYSTWRVALLRA